MATTGTTAAAFNAVGKSAAIKSSSGAPTRAARPAVAFVRARSSSSPPPPGPGTFPTDLRARVRADLDRLRASREIAEDRRRARLWKIAMAIDEIARLEAADLGSSGGGDAVAVDFKDDDDFYSDDDDELKAPASGR